MNPATKVATTLTQEITVNQKHIYIGLAASAALMLTACAPFRASGAANATNTATATRGTINQSVDATGTIISGNEAKLSFQQSGVVQTVRVTIGDAVRKGDVLAELDTTDLSLNVRQAEAQLAQSKNAVRNAEQAIIIAQANYSRTVDGTREADMKAAEAALASAKANYTKVNQTQSSEAAAAQAAVDAAQANLDKLKAGPTDEEIAGVRAQLQNAEAALRSAQSAYDRAYSQNPAGISASPAAIQLEQATNNYNLAKSNYDKVAKGADDAQIRAAEQQLASAKANLARSGGASIAANRSAAQQQIETAQANLDRLKEPARAFDLAQLDAQIAQAHIALDNARSTVTLNEVAVAQAKRRLDQAVLRAPFDGVVGSVNVREGESVSAQGAPTSAFVIADTTGFRMDLTVDELDVAHLRPGQIVNINVDALPGVAVTGKVERISSTSTRVNGVVNYSVRVALDNDNEALKSGMSATARIELDRKDDALLVPATAVRRDNVTGKYVLTVRNGNQDQDVEVITGLRDGSTIEIVSGIADGATVVIR
jgi:HlyD family secretion protein